MRFLSPYPLNAFLHYVLQVEGYHHLFCVKDYIDIEAPGLHYGAYMLYPADEQQAQELFSNLTQGVIDNGFVEGIQLLWKKVWSLISTCSGLPFRVWLEGHEPCWANYHRCGSWLVRQLLLHGRGE